MAAGNAVTVVAGGDVVIQRPKPEEAFAQLAPVFKGADISLCNQEYPLCDGSLPLTPYGRRNKGHCDREMVEGLAAAGFDFVGLANNHMMDYQAEGLLQTLDSLEKKGIPYIGAGRNLKEARAPLILERKGTRIAFLCSYSGDLSGLKAGAHKPGITMVRLDPLLPAPHLFPEEVEVLQEDIAAAKRQADIVVLFEHWGVSFTAQLSIPALALGRSAIDAGADVIIGNHAHQLQGIGVYKGKAIFYALGNLVFDSRSSQRIEPTQTGLARLTIADKRIEKISFLPVEGSASGQARLLPKDSPEAQAIVAKMVKLSQPLGTSLEYVDGELVVLT